MGSVGNTTNINVTELENTKYRGVWYGAKQKPISVKQLLDNVIKSDGRGFNVRTQDKVISDSLLESGVTEYILTDEENRGKFKLTNNGRQYLISKLSANSYLRLKLENHKK